MPMTTFDPVTGECRAVFRLPAEAGARRAWLAGDFNDWSTDALPLEAQPDGSLAVEVVLEPGRSYRFRYYLGGGRWDNDWDADAYEDNDFGGADSVLVVPPTPGRPHPTPEPDIPAAPPRARVESDGNGATRRRTSPKSGRRKAPDRDRVADV
jgi:hypothetical protein